MVARTRRLLVLPWIAALALPLAACSSGDGGVVVTENEFSIAFDDADLQAGEVTFDVSNDGDQTHEFVILKTDLAEGDLPTTADGDVDEEGEGIEPVDEIEDITAGSTKSLTVQLDPGTYVAICNLPTHYGRGMHATITVS